MKRFIEKIDASQLWGCWLWTATKNEDGYGQFKLDGQMRRAHKVSYELFVGPIPEGLDVLHKCDNRGCVNPNHLEVGTHGDNMRQMAERGRSAKGEGHGSAKLTEDQVLEIRGRYAAGGVSQRALAAEYGVSHTTIRRVVSNKNWTHI